MIRRVVKAGVIVTAAATALLFAPAGIFIARWEVERARDWWQDR